MTPEGKKILGNFVKFVEDLSMISESLAALSAAGNIIRAEIVQYDDLHFQQLELPVMSKIHRC